MVAAARVFLCPVVGEVCVLMVRGDDMNNRARLMFGKKLILICFCI